MKITIVGAGNIGTQFAVHCAEKGHKVIIYGSKPNDINREISIIDENNQLIHKGIIEKATNSESEAFSDADLIFVTMPAPMMKNNASKIEPYVQKGMMICLVPGTGGGECAFRGCIEKEAIVFGMQRVPSVARLVDYGKIVKAVGYRSELYVAALPSKMTVECCKLIEGIFDIKTVPLPNYLNITLTPSNPILHTTRLKKLYEDYHEGIVYKNVPLFYEDWNDDTSELLLACDEEVQELCRKLNQFDLSFVKSLRQHYESPTAEALTKKISSIIGFKGLKSPIVKVEGGFIPDFNSRYFTADFPYGLEILKQIAEFLEVDAHNIKRTLEWYNNLVKNQKKFDFKDYNINSCDEFIRFYQN